MTTKHLTAIEPYLYFRLTRTYRYALVAQLVRAADS